MEKIRLGVVGLGHRGRALVKMAALFDNVEITAVCDLIEKNWFEQQWLSAAPLSEMFPEAKFYLDYDEMLEKNIREYFSYMADLTGTLWEYEQPNKSCNHGFASHLAHVLNRDVLGIYDINPARKVITLRFTECSLGSCKGSIPVGKGAVVLEWTMNDGKVDALLSLPKGYRYEIDPTSLPATIHKK